MAAEASRARRLGATPAADAPAIEGARVIELAPANATLLIHWLDWKRPPVAAGPTRTACELAITHLNHGNDDAEPWLPMREGTPVDGRSVLALRAGTRINCLSCLDVWATRAPTYAASP